MLFFSHQIDNYFFARFISFALCLMLLSCNDTSQRDKAFDEVQSKTAETSAAAAHAEDVASVKIGSQVWAVKNLDVSSFKNGEPIPEVKTAEDWEAAGAVGKPAWCFFDNDSTNGKQYGKLYNWFAVTDPRGLAPSGWHIPSNDEWTILTDNLGGADVAGIKLKADTGWLEKGDGNNASGFTALPGGYRFFVGLFLNAGQDGGWWTSTLHSDGYAWLRYLYSNDRNIYVNHMHCKMGFSVRCVKD